MPPNDARGLFAVLEQVSDSRGRQEQRHPLTAMLAGVVCATLCGARGFKPIAQWLRAQVPTTWHWLGFKCRPPVRMVARPLEHRKQIALGPR